MGKKILFDVDGVFLSEDRCFDATALAVDEFMKNNYYLNNTITEYNVPQSNKEIKKIRSIILNNDSTLKFMKAKGINSNLEMIYLLLSHQIINILKFIETEKNISINDYVEEPYNSETLSFLKKQLNEIANEYIPDYTLFIDTFTTCCDADNLLEIPNYLAKKQFNLSFDLFPSLDENELWYTSSQLFQEWYLGDIYFEEVEKKQPIQNGKKGFLKDEVLLAPLHEIKQLLNELKIKGYTLGIGTSRSKIEVIVPFEELGLIDYFDRDLIITYSEVMKAENELNLQGLGKPHPYTYLKGVYPVMSEKELMNLSLPIKAEDSYIVGDSIADYLAARDLGITFIAPLTGLSGKEAKGEFESLNVPYIIDNVLDLRNIL